MKTALIITALEFVDWFLSKYSDHCVSAYQLDRKCSTQYLGQNAPRHWQRIAYAFDVTALLLLHFRIKFVFLFQFNHPLFLICCSIFYRIFDMSYRALDLILKIRLNFAIVVVWHTNDVNRNILQSVWTIVLHAYITKLFRYTLWNSCNHRTLSILYGNNVSQFPWKNISTASVTIKALASNADHSSKMSHIHTAMPCQSPQKKNCCAIRWKLCWTQISYKSNFSNC